MNTKLKKQLILSSMLTLLPIAVGLLLWDAFPDRIATHWNFAGQPDGWSSVPVTVFGLPLLMLAGQLFCTWLTLRDPGNRNQSRKPLALVLWIIPVISNLCCCITYALALGVEFSPTSWLLIVLGLFFAAIGNYLPKVKMNSTMGIKLPWTYTSTENWNATHRFSGRIWFFCGLGMAACGLLPGSIAVTAMLILLPVLILLPTFYSWRYYRMQKARGDTLQPMLPQGKMGKGSLAALIVLPVLVAGLLFTGDIGYQFREDSLYIEADYYGDYVVAYDSIQDLELREMNMDGIRVNGFGSFRLLMGYFQNQEFGTYTRYTYCDPEACVVVYLKNQILVLSGATREETQALYTQLLEKVTIT